MKFIDNVYENGQRTSTRYNPLPLVPIYAGIAMTNALPVIAYGDQPATEENVHALMHQAIIAVIFLGMTTEAGANQLGEAVFSEEFDEFERCQQRFGKGFPKGTPDIVKKWHWLFQARGRDADYTARIRPGLTTFFEARNRLTHYQVSKNAQKWHLEQATNPGWRVIFSANDRYQLTDLGITAALKPLAVRRYYDTVREVFRLWCDAMGQDARNVDLMLPPPPAEK